MKVTIDPKQLGDIILILLSESIYHFGPEEYFNFFIWFCLTQKAYVIHWVRLDRYSSAEEALNDGIDRLETLVSRVHDIVTWVNCFYPFYIGLTFQINGCPVSFLYLQL
jgi:hypothetical protein